MFGFYWNNNACFGKINWVGYGIGTNSGTRAKKENKMTEELMIAKMEAIIQANRALYFAKIPFILYIAFFENSDSYIISPHNSDEFKRKDPSTWNDMMGL